MPSTITIMPPPRPTDAAPAYTALAVTPSDAVGFAACRGLYVGADGDITAVMVGAQTPVLFAAARARAGILNRRAVPVASAAVRARRLICHG